MVGRNRATSKVVVRTLEMMRHRQTASLNPPEIDQNKNVDFPVLQGGKEVFPLDGLWCSLQVIAKDFLNLCTFFLGEELGCIGILQQSGEK